MYIFHSINLSFQDKKMIMVTMRLQKLEYHMTQWV